MERAAVMAQEARPDFIDINCGCWVRKIANRGDGAGLLRDLPRLQAVVAAVQRGTTLPVTVKTRLGWDQNSHVILELARMLADMGIQHLTVHCRTRAQGYSGEADWTWLPRIKEAAPRLPLIGNGDIRTPRCGNDVSICCDGVMIGRAAMQQPEVFRAMRHCPECGELAEPSWRNAKAMCIEHLRRHGSRRAPGIFPSGAIADI